MTTSNYQDPALIAWPVRLSAEVTDALHEGHPVIGLESNVISHGLPRPLNLDSARDVEAAVRRHGVVPATTAIIDGEVVVGLSPAELERMAVGAGIRKASSQNLAVCLASGQPAATTIAATMAIAHWTGIQMVASAGLGGVHRNVTETMDISADLVQLTRAKVMLVCAGAKSILDLPKTLELLETQSVPVIGYRSSHFPAFYLTSSGIKCPDRIDDPETLNRAAQIHWTIPGSAGLVVTHPIEQTRALSPEVVETAIQVALQQAETKGIKGSAVTKFLMAAVDEATHGEASAANAAVLESTAAVAAEIASKSTSTSRVSS